MAFRAGDVLGLLWSHPIVSCGVLLLFTPPLFPIVVFFSPLLISTALCVLALVSMGSDQESPGQYRRVQEYYVEDDRMARRAKSSSEESWLGWVKNLEGNSRTWMDAKLSGSRTGSMDWTAEGRQDFALEWEETEPSKPPVVDEIGNVPIRITKVKRQDVVEEELPTAAGTVVVASKSVEIPSGGDANSIVPAEVAAIPSSSTDVVVDSVASLEVDEQPPALESLTDVSVGTLKESADVPIQQVTQSQTAEAQAGGEGVSAHVVDSAIGDKKVNLVPADNDIGPEPTTMKEIGSDVVDNSAVTVNKPKYTWTSVTKKIDSEEIGNDVADKERIVNAGADRQKYTWTGLKSDSSRNLQTEVLKDDKQGPVEEAIVDHPASAPEVPKAEPTAIHRVRASIDLTNTSPAVLLSDRLKVPLDDMISLLQGDDIDADGAWQAKSVGEVPIVKESLPVPSISTSKDQWSSSEDDPSPRKASSDEIGLVPPPPQEKKE